MIPVSLAIKGLYSYQTLQVIEFDRLLDGQLFGIFGSVGSGKSSILEAMTFALYGQSERLDRNDNRNYNMMNLKSDELLIDFIFRNFDEQMYRFTVRGKRHGKDFDKVNTFERTAYRNTGGIWIPLEQTNAEFILGLSYDNFRRTVIIPQGKFQEFLQLGDKDRTNMLKEIFQLDKYEFFYQTTALEKKNNEAIQHLDGQLMHYLLVNQEGIASKQEEVAGLSSQLDDRKKELLEVEATLSQQLELKRWFEDLEKQREKLSELLQQEPHYQQLSKGIAAYEYCLLHFKQGLNRKKELQADISERSDRIKEHKERLIVASRELESIELQFEQVKAAFQKQEENAQLATDYRILMELKRIGAEIEKQHQRLQAGKPHLQQAREEKAVSEHRVAELKEQIRDQKQRLPDVALLSGLRAWHAERKTIARGVSDLQADLKKLEQQLVELPQGLQSHLTALRFPLDLDGRSFSLCQEQVQQLRNENQQQQEALRSQIGHFELQLKLGEFVDELSKGGPCLLCGSEHHPRLLAVEDVNEHLLQARRKEEESRQYDRSCEQLLQVLHGLQQNEQGLQRQLEQLKLRLQTEEKHLDDHNNRFIWTAFDRQDEAGPQQAFQMYEEEKVHLERLEKDLEETEAKCSEATVRHEKYRQGLEEIQSLITAREAERSALSGQLKLLQEKGHENYAGQELERMALDLERKIVEVRKAYEDLSVQIEKHQSEKISLLERIQSHQEVLLKDETAIEQLNQTLQESLNQSPFSSWEEVGRILAEELDLPRLKSELQAYEQQLHTCRQILSNLEKNTQGKIFDPEAFDLLQSRVSNMKDQLQQINDEYVKARAELEKQQNDLKQKLILEERLDHLNKRAANLNTLKQLFKGSGFVNYVSSVYLHQLCEAANERFYKLTRQSLRLEVTDKNEFQVRDFLNDGKVRSVKTLSGGQTFQASLSLALALAESVQQQNKAKQNFFFLDEGFGSLDKDSLQVAFETLKSLRKENRKVGVISHVEELQQEIDVFLQVINDPLKGSSVRGNWE